ncbi:hypothetical protein [uncultured Dokdonia sp.]|uniref:hypothetical protein n=1 Tax=uncultured Dokdonia sp. TaxID=575653 RepID=UPI00261C7616|nr:hypothetical protein [uncultured Dokdonia sp.]
MKFNICILFLLIANSMSSQTPKEKLTSLICNCYEEAPQTENVNFELLKTCFDFSSEPYTPILEEAVREEFKKLHIDTLDTSSNYQNGYKIGSEIGQQLMNDVQEPLINSCDTYFEFMEKTKKEMVSNLGKDLNKKRVDSLKRLFKKKDWQPDIQWEIGAYYLSKGKHKKAEKNFKKCLSKDGTHMPSLFFLAIIDDFNEKYTSSIHRLEAVDLNPSHPFMFMRTIYIEAAKRKKRESRP